MVQMWSSYDSPDISVHQVTSLCNKGVFVDWVFVIVNSVKSEIVALTPHEILFKVVEYSLTFSPSQFDENERVDCCKNTTSGSSCANIQIFIPSRIV